MLPAPDGAVTAVYTHTNYAMILTIEKRNIIRNAIKGTLNSASGDTIENLFIIILALIYDLEELEAHMSRLSKTMLAGGDVVDYLDSFLKMLPSEATSQMYLKEHPLLTKSLISLVDCLEDLKQRLGELHVRTTADVTQ